MNVKQLGELITLDLFKIMIAGGKVTLELQEDKSKEVKALLEEMTVAEEQSPKKQQSPKEQQSPKKRPRKSVLSLTGAPREEVKEEKGIEGVPAKVPCVICDIVVCKEGLVKHRRSKKHQDNELKLSINAQPDFVNE